jgi:hypothetical protein
LGAICWVKAMPLARKTPCTIRPWPSCCSTGGPRSRSSTHCNRFE